MTATLRTPFNLSAHLRPTVGDQKITYVGVDHMGWMKCDGRSLSRTTYALLFNVIGTTFGAEDSSTFKLPDYRGMVPGIAGQPTFSNNANPTIYALGDKTGEQQHKLTVDEMPTHNHGTQTDLSGAPPELYNLTSTEGQHSHTYTDPGHTHNITDPGHAHSYFNEPFQHDVAVSLTTTDTADNINQTQTTSSNTTGISINTSTIGITINSNGAHAHYLANTGGSNWHNNMQPTLFGGNMFIYSGKNIQAYYPYTWVGGIPAADTTAANPGVVSIY